MAVGGGLSKSWTPERERKSQRLIDGCCGFAMQHLLMHLRDLEKYDQRTREGKRASSRATLRIATATDEELEELAKLQSSIMEETDPELVAEKLEKLKGQRARLWERRINRSELGGS